VAANLSFVRATAPAPPPSALPEEVQSSFDYMPATLSGTLAGVAVISVLFWGLAPASVALPWLAAWLVVLLARGVTTLRFRRALPDTLADWQRWRHISNAGTFASAVMWGLTAWIFYPRGESIQQIGLIVVVYTFCVVAVPVLATQPRIYIAYATLLMGPLAVRIASGGTSDSYKLAAILLIIITLTVMLASNFRQALQRAIALKLEADGLLVQLRAEKQAADEARREAEVANRAKTQFFTAASHDLRQPLHAMGLFAEALRQKVHDDEIAPLVNSINSSVDALEGLFSELLDITRIDNGGVDVSPLHFDIDDIFRKLRLNFEPTAFEKGLALRFRGRRHVAHADPLLVERVLRNLVSNAIRYTHDGGVLVSCRRRGQTLRLSVWDTGPGIAEADRQRIFEEFYQLESNAEHATPEQRKGLGLGLAIVRKLCGLMGAPLSLRSVPGHGSVFTFEVPVGRVSAPSVAAVSSKGPRALTLEGRLIVVVEDEPAVRSGLEVLMRGWGATLRSFASVADCEAWVASDAAARPDLVITDYRLEQGRNGVDTIRAVRGRFGADVPAIVVTGSTMTGHDKEAHDEDFHLLIKPVLPNKLRAMIAFKLGVK